MLGLLTFIGGVRKKALARAQRARWGEEEAALDAARAEAEAAFRREHGLPPAGPPGEGEDPRRPF
jgi:hypothetical protein